MTWRKPPLISDEMVVNVPLSSVSCQARGCLSRRWRWIVDRVKQKNGCRRVLFWKFSRKNHVTVSSIWKLCARLGHKNSRHGNYFVLNMRIAAKIDNRFFPRLYSVKEVFMDPIELQQASNNNRIGIFNFNKNGLDTALVLFQLSRQHLHHSFWRNSLAC